MPLSALSPCARLLAEAKLAVGSLPTLPADIAPTTDAAAYGIQRELFLSLQSSLGGWKVGAKSPTADINGSVLPNTSIHPSGVTLARSAFTWIGLELEIAFRLNHSFLANQAPHPPEAILASIASQCPSIELVTSRIQPNPTNPRRWAIADLLNHGALVVGEEQPYLPDYPFLTPRLSWTFNGQNIAPETPPANPAGDPRRLLPWIVNHCCQQGWDFHPDMVITAGTYTGIFKPTEAGQAIGTIDGLGSVILNLL